METPVHTLNDLFAQLGLPSADTEIERFITCHTPLAEEVRLCDAPFWSASQSSFLRDGWSEDSDWAELVDELDLALRRPPSVLH